MLLVPAGGLTVVTRVPQMNGKKKLYYRVCHRTEKVYNLYIINASISSEIAGRQRGGMNVYIRQGAIPDHALYPVHIFVDTCIDARCQASTNRWPKTCHTDNRICGDFCSLYLQGSTRVTLKNGEKNIISLTVPA